MNKNLKKVISAVAALAISASAVSAFAVNFPDVPEDASYAQAVQELSALDVISGYDDGTFKPDELVTRAQITKMIVDALNERELAEASKANSQFTDVNDHWAKGYINQGVSDQFIAGYGDGTFGPDDNVTYVQAQKMLVSAIGYETYAQGSGGWPNGYKTWASSQGITDGISGIADDTQLTRAQVAQLVDNAMGAPICVIKDYDTTIDGRRVPNLEIKDDEGKDYQTLFTKKHNAYKVYGRVTKTNKTDNSVDVDKVEFTVEKADNFDDQWIGVAKNADDTEVPVDAYYGDSKAVDYLLTYAQALIQKNSNDEFTILSITPAATTKSVTLAAEDFDEDKTNKEATDNGITKLYFFPAGSSRNSQKYAIAPDDEKYAVYVNGVKNDTLTNDVDELVKYIAANDTAAVTLEKQTKTGSTNTTTDYNLIQITSYETAVVKSVSAKNDEVTVNFDKKSTNIGKSRITFELDNEDKVYDVTYNGEAIDVADLKEDDVLSIAWDGQDDPSESSFIDVIVSRDVVEEAKVTSTNDADKEYTINNTDIYKIASGMEKAVKLEMSATYTLYLDHFGRIAKADEDSVTKKIAILKNVYKKAGGDYYAQIITKEGTEVEYKVDSDNVTKYQGYIKATKDSNGEAVYNTTDSKKSDFYPQQVIEYSVSSSSNKITIKSVLPITQASKTGKAEYKAATNKIGSVKLSDASVILDLSEVDAKDNYSIISTLTDGTEYEAYGYDESKSGSTYHRFVIITEGVASYNYDTQLAVIKKVNDVDDDDSTKTSYDLVINGDDATYVVDEDAELSYGDANAVKAGDVILFTVNGAGYISKAQLVFDKVNRLAGTNYESFRDALLKDGLKNDALTAKDDWKGFFNGKDADDVEIVWGVVANSLGNTVNIAKPVEFTYPEDAENSGKTIGINYDNNDEEYTYGNAIIYTYDFSAGTTRGNSRVSATDGFIETETNSAVEYDVENEDGVKQTYLDLKDDEVINDIVFAVARVDGDEVLEMYLIYAD